MLVNSMWIAAIFMLQNNQVCLAQDIQPLSSGCAEHHLAFWTNFQQHHIRKHTDTRTGAASATHKNLNLNDCTQDSNYVCLC